MLWHLSLLSLLPGVWGCGPFIYLCLTRICLKRQYEGQLLYPLQRLLHIVGVIGDNRNVVDIYKKTSFTKFFGQRCVEGLIDQQKQSR